MTRRTHRSPALRRELAAMARARLNQRRMWRTGYRAAKAIDPHQGLESFRQRIASLTVDVSSLVMAGRR